MRTGHSLSPGSRGFTLLELLVVIVIVGIIAAMATLSVGTATATKGVDEEARRIGDLVALASEEAVMHGREIGLTFYRREYEFSTYDPEQSRWVPLAGAAAGPLAGRALPPESELEVEIEGRMIKLLDEKPPPPKRQEADGDDDQPERGTGQDDNAPQVFIFSSGDVTPFTVHLRPGLGQPGVELDVNETGGAVQKRDES